MTSEGPLIETPPSHRGPWALLGAVPEPLFALLTAFLVTALLTLPFIPTILEVEVPLRPEPASGTRTTPEELTGRIESLGLGRSVEVLPDGGFGRLVVRGVSSREAIELPLSAVLERAGFESPDPEFARSVDMDALVGSGAAKLPWVMTIQAFVFSFGGIALIRLRLREPSSMPTAAPLRAALLGGAAGLVAVAVGVALSLLLERLGLPVREQEWLAELFRDPGALVRLVPWIVIVGPVSEEIFFRGYIFRFIRERAGIPAGLLISSVLFAVIHFNLSGFLIYLVIGCAMGWAYQRTNSLVAPIVGHAAANSIALTVSSLAAGLEGQPPPG